MVWQSVNTLEQLLDKSNTELRQLIQINGNIEENEDLRWQRAMFNLKRCHQTMLSGRNNEPTDLSWTFWSGSVNLLAESSPRVSESDNAIHMPSTPNPFERGPLIAHRFTKKFRALSTCDYCNKQMFFGLKCIECKYSCHNDCEASVPPSCGVQRDLIAEFKQTFNQDASNQVAQPSPEIVEAGNGFFFSRTSSRKTSTATFDGNSSNGQRRESQTLSVLKNYFEELSSTLDLRKDSVRGDAKVDSVNQFGSHTASNHVAPKSAETISLSESLVSNESTNFDASDDRKSEWGIQFDDIKLMDRIGRGRFGTVHRAQWYGDVAVKLLNANYLDDTQSLEAFKIEVATFKNTRHENLVLFMGFCTRPQAIVTSLCKGNTLYTHIHSLRDKFNLFRATNFAQQIATGMGYLHAKGIIHKDLTTKNIFLENCRVVITDFGLFSATKMQYDNNGFHVPSNWLCYLAPELIRGLKQTQNAHDELRLTKASDLYAFGTVWYEILSGEFPFNRQPAHTIIYQIGCGMKQTLANLQATREVKDILMLSWAYQPEDRPVFSVLLQLMQDLPNKQMPRNPKRQIHLSLSAESVF